MVSGNSQLLVPFIFQGYNVIEVMIMETKDVLLELRTKHGFSQDDLAEKVHVTRQAVSNWETGKTQPDIETLTSMAEYFGVSVEYLIYGKEPVTNTGEEVHRWVWDRGRLHFAVNWYPERFAALGVVLAMIISYVNWRSIGWVLLHGLLNWGYVLYYIIRY